MESLQQRTKGEEPWAGVKRPELLLNVPGQRKIVGNGFEAETCRIGESQEGRRVWGKRLGWGLQ